MQDECLTEHGLRLIHAAGPAGDAAQQTEGVGRAELVAEQALLREALGRSLPPALVITCHPVDQCQSGQRIALPGAVARILVLGQRPAEVLTRCHLIARVDSGEPEIVVRQRDPARRARLAVDGERFLEALPR